MGCARVGVVRPVGATVIALVLIGAYALGFLATWRPAFRYVVRAGVSDADTMIEVAFCIFLATVAAATWPPWALGAACRAVFGDAESMARALGGESRRERAGRRGRELADLEASNRRRERELGLAEAGELTDEDLDDVYREFTSVREDAWRLREDAWRLRR